VSLRLRLVLAGAAGCLLVFWLASLLQPWLQAGGAYPWRAAAVLSVMTGASLLFAGGHPFPALGPANQVTLVRAMLVALAAGLIGEPAASPVATAAVVAIAGIAVLDGVDGWLARRSRMASAFGARIDMETDAVLVLVLSLLVWQHGKGGVWILAAGLMRYVFVAAGWVLPWMAGPLEPTFRAKAVAVGTLVGLSVALAPFVPPSVSEGVAAVTLAALAWSFAVDVRRLRRNRSV
jgi:phosphatidylglycerophosphate synthase